MKEKEKGLFLKSKKQEQWLKENKPNIYKLLEDSLPEGAILPERLGSQRLSEKRQLARKNALKRE